MRLYTPAPYQTDFVRFEENLDLNAMGCIWSNGEWTRLYRRLEQAIYWALAESAKGGGTNLYEFLECDAGALAPDSQPFGFLVCQGTVYDPLSEGDDLGPLLYHFTDGEEGHQG